MKRRGNRRARQEPTVSGQELHALVRTVDASGFDGRELALQAGVSRRALQNPEERIPHTAMTGLWRAAVDVTGNPAIGLSFARYLTPATFGALSYAALASADLRSLFLRLGRYQRLLNDAIDLRFERTGEHYEWSLRRLAREIPPDEGIDALFAVVVRSVRGLTAPRPVEARLVSMRRPEPADPEPYHRLFRAPVRFGAERDSLTYNWRDMEVHLPDGNAELAAQNDRIVADLLQKLRDESTAGKVREVLLTSLPDGPTEQAIVKKLGMSKSALHLALSREGVTYRYVLNRTREELARGYLEAGRYSIKEIAFLLGFSDATTFSRAFKRWTGRSPGQYAGASRGRDLTGHPSARFSVSG